jgi:hypothetical protein
MLIIRFIILVLIFLLGSRELLIDIPEIVFYNKHTMKDELKNDPSFT